MTMEEAIYRLKNMAWLYGSDEREQNLEAIDMAVEALQTEVVRCKDCIHYESDGGALMVCRIDDMVVDDTDYCSYGERKGGGSE